MQSPLPDSHSVDDAWPKGSPKADPEKLLREAEQIAGIRVEFEAAKKVVERSATAEILLKDMPEDVLDGRLGEITTRRLADFPLSYAWPAMLAAGSALIDQRGPNVRTNLYVGLVGPVHTGKSQVIDRSCKILGVEAPVLLEAMSGSGEQLVRATKDGAGNPRLFSPDELGHTLEKLHIERSSLGYILNTAYYRDRFEVQMGRRETVLFDCVLSLVGGLVEDRFQELFNMATCGGLYDRFTFGVCPDNFQYDYRPHEGPREHTFPVSVRIDPGVWELKSSWEKEYREFNPRVVEGAIRAAAICAAFNGKELLRAEDLDPHLEFVRYQTRIRTILRPNPGETIEGRLANKFLDYLARYKGTFVSKRQMLRDTRGYDLGPVVCDRVLSVLVANGDIVMAKVGKRELVRLAVESELDLDQPES
jgi:hypothetical protein